MFIVDPTGKLIYNGAIDDKRSANPADAKIAQQLRPRGARPRRLAGKPVTRRQHAALRLRVKY